MVQVARELRRIVIAGAGQAGFWCAKTLRMEGFTGSILLLGDEPHPPYDRPPLSKAVLLGHASPPSTHYVSVEGLAEQQIDFHAGETIEEIDRARRTVRTTRGGLIRYDHLVLATGASVRRVSIPGSEDVSVHYLRGMEDCMQLRQAIAPGRKVVVLGGGLIGLEVAAASTKLGAHATVVEAASRVMARIVGPEVSLYFHHLHTEHGVEILTGRQPSELRASGGGIALHLDGGGAVEGDIFVAGIGVQPNDSIAAKAGLRTENGIWVDPSGRTDDPDISAIGDVANRFHPLLRRRVRLETWHNAKSQAISLARNLCGQSASSCENPWGWSDQFGTNLQMLGMPETLEGGIVRGASETGSFSVFYLKDGRIDGVTAVNAVRDVAASRRLMADGTRVDPALLRDTSVPLKELLSA